MAVDKGQVFNDAADDAAIASATASGDSADTAAAAANSRITGIDNQENSSYLHAQATAAFTDPVEGVEYAMGAKGWALLAAANAANGTVNNASFASYLASLGLEDGLTGASAAPTALISTGGTIARTTLPSVSPELFGAVGDGVADDTPAILAALTVSRHVKGTPGKTYKFGTSLELDPALHEWRTLDLTESSVTFTANDEMINATGTSYADPIRGLDIRLGDVTCTGSGNAQQVIYLRYVQYSTVRFASILNVGINAGTVYGCKNVVTHGGEIKDNGKIGWLYYDCEDCHDYDIVVDNCGWWGHQFKSSVRCTSTNLSVSSAGEYGLYTWVGLDGIDPGDRRCQDCHYVRPYVATDSGGKNAIYINASEGITVHSPRIDHGKDGWAAIAISGASSYDEGSGEVDSYSDHCRILDLDLRVASGVTANGVTLGGTVDHDLTGVVVTGRIEGAVSGVVSTYTDETCEIDLRVHDCTIGIDARDDLSGRVRAYDCGTGVKATLGAVVRLDRMEIVRSTTIPFSTDATSEIHVEGLVMRKCVGPVILYSNSTIADGAIIEDARFGESSGDYFNVIRVYGSGNYIGAGVYRRNSGPATIIAEYASSLANYYAPDWIGNWSRTVSYGTTSASSPTWFRSNTAPASGNYVAGCEARRSTWAAGVAERLTCVTAGAPGTWVAVGQLGYRSGSGAPAVTPAYIGEEWLDTTNGKWYKAKGATSGDWVALN